MAKSAQPLSLKAQIKRLRADIKHCTDRKRKPQLQSALRKLLAEQEAQKT